jgi:phospholipid/cholesterol/gamma-HCH transport system permease protein
LVYRRIVAGSSQDFMTSIESVSDEPEAWFKLDRDGRQLSMGGAWTIAESARLDRELGALDLAGKGDVSIDASKIERLDSAGAWLLLRTRRALEAAGTKVSGFIIPELYQPLLKNLDQERKAEPHKSRIPSGFRGRLYRIGRATMHAWTQTISMLGYLGRVTVETGEAVASPGHKLRVAAMFHQVEETGINALPIVGLLAFLIGVVLAYQGVDQLKKFGAEVFTINILGVGLLREIAGLITAIIVAGRSGSAFAAQIGTMTVTEEIDAMRTLGISPLEQLVLPKFIALVIALPLLTMYADAVGVFGGMVMARGSLGVGYPEFLERFVHAVEPHTFLVGIAKAPVFAAIIAVVGCFQGFRTNGGADSVGRQTTKSVVQSIFLVIVADALFSIAFSALNL